MSDDLIEQARAGAVLRPKRWSGDTHADLGGSIDEDATDELLNALADEIERLRAEALDAAIIVGAQTLDLKAIGKGRKAILKTLVSRLCDLADGERLPPRRQYPHYYKATTTDTRERFDLNGDADEH